MVKSNLKEQKVIKKADLKVVDNNAVKTTAYSDINLKKWREYDHIKTDTLWEFPNRLKEGGHSNEYHGNYIPQIAQQIYERYTKKNDIVLDLFFGSGTSGIEAINMGRRCIGVELKDELAESVSEKFTPKQLVTEEFYDLFEKVAKNGYDLLEKGRFACLIIGDKYANSQHIPLGFECMARMNKLGFITKAIIIKDMQGNERAKGKTANLWRYRALAGGFYIFKHEYVMVFQKV